MFAENLAGTVLNPAGGALTRVIVGTGPQLTAANALNSLSGSVLRLVAPVLGTLLLALSGFRAVVLVDGGSYLAAASAAVLIARRVGVREPPAAGRRTLRAELAAGLAVVARTPLLRGPLAGSAFFLVANSGLSALLVPLVEGPLVSPGYAVGYLVTGLGAGYAVGSALARFRIRQLLAGTQLAIAAAYFLLVDAPDLATAVAATALMGVPGSILLVAVGTHVQRTAPPGMQGRVGALRGAASALATVAGALCAPALGAAAGLGAATNALSAFALLAAAATWLLVPSGPRRPPTARTSSTVVTAAEGRETAPDR